MAGRALRIHPGWGAVARGPGQPAAAARAPAGAGYRVEHRGAGGAVVLGHLPADTPPHHAPLAPWASHLRLAGLAAGEVVLVEAGTGAVVARRRLAGRRRPRGAR